MPPGLVPFEPPSTPPGRLPVATGKAWRSWPLGVSFPGLPRPSPLCVSESQTSPFCLLRTLVIGLRAHPQSWMTSFNPLHHFIDDKRSKAQVPPLSEVTGPFQGTALPGLQPLAGQRAGGMGKRPGPLLGSTAPAEGPLHNGQHTQGVSLLWPRLSVLSNLLGSDKRSHSLQAVRRNWVGMEGQ